MRFYLSGPITKLGVEEAKFRFDTCESAFAAKYSTHEFINPMRLFPQGKSWLWYMCQGLFVLSMCDGIIMLPEWKTSRGAKIERMFAKLCRNYILEM